MPPSNAAKILGLLDSGQLTMQAGTGAVPQATGPTPAVQTAHGTRRFDYLINAITPAHYGGPPAATELMDSAARGGLASNHYAGGVCIDRTTSRVHDRTGTANPQLYALGDLTRGSYLFVNGLPVLVSRSAAISQAIYTHTQQPASVTDRRLVSWATMSETVVFGPFEVSRVRPPSTRPT
jgi:uncharacterized NAD(P)/FAD-binding protein YdhS